MGFATTDWTTTVSENEWNESKSIAVANDGSIYILGNSKGDLNGQETNLAWHITYNGSNAAADSTENTMVAHGDLA